MDVNRVSQRSDVLLQETATARREARETQRSEREDRSVAERSAAESRPVEKNEQAKPVLNSQGQTTGTLVNTSA